MGKDLKLLRDNTKGVDKLTETNEITSRKKK